MKKTIDNLLIKLKNHYRVKRERKNKRNQLYNKLIQNDHKCRKLRLQMAKTNIKATAKSQYKINEGKVKQIIFLTLNQIEIKNQLKNERKWISS